MAVIESLGVGRLIALATLFAVCGTADAYGSLRCKGKIVRVGDTKAEVVARCGAPAGRTVEEIPVRTRTINGFSRLTGVATDERLVYNRGWGRFPAVLTFQNGVLLRIDYLNTRADKE